jgi:hypothetical protein
MHETLTRALVNEITADRIRVAERERFARTVRPPRRRPAWPSLHFVRRHARPVG